MGHEYVVSHLGRPKKKKKKKTMRSIVFAYVKKEKANTSQNYVTQSRGSRGTNVRTRSMISVRI